MLCPLQLVFIQVFSQTENPICTQSAGCHFTRTMMVWLRCLLKSRSSFHPCLSSFLFLQQYVMLHDMVAAHSIVRVSVCRANNGRLNRFMSLWCIAQFTFLLFTCSSAPLPDRYWRDPVHWSGTRWCDRYPQQWDHHAVWRCAGQWHLHRQWKHAHRLVDTHDLFFFPFCCQP